MVAGAFPQELKPEWVDVDFEKEARRCGRELGCVWEEAEVRDQIIAATSFEASGISVIAEDDWKEVFDEKQGYSLRSLALPRKDQDGEGSCTSNNQTRGFEYTFARSYGRAFWISFSPMSLYQLCASSSGSGSSLSCNITKARDVGFLPSDTPENRKRFGSMVLKDVGYSQRSNPRPDGWQEFAKQFRIREYVKLTTVEQFASCLLMDLPISYGRSGHAICGGALVWRNGRWYVAYDNSWGAGWGDDGWGYDTLSSRLLGYGVYASTAIWHPQVEGLHLPPTPYNLVM